LSRRGRPKKIIVIPLNLLAQLRHAAALAELYPDLEKAFLRVHAPQCQIIRKGRRANRWTGGWHCVAKNPPAELASEGEFLSPTDTQSEQDLDRAWQFDQVKK
jgi:hypothetical protein